MMYAIQSSRRYAISWQTLMTPTSNGSSSPRTICTAYPETEWNLVLFKADVPALQELTLSGLYPACVDLRSPVFSNLFKLSIHIRHLSALTVSHYVSLICDLIRRSPNLRRLDIRDVCESIDNTLSDSAPRSLLGAEVAELGTLRIEDNDVLHSLLGTNIFPNVCYLGDPSYDGHECWILSAIITLNALPALRRLVVLGGSQSARNRGNVNMPGARRAGEPRMFGIIASGRILRSAPIMAGGAGEMLLKARKPCFLEMSRTEGEVSERDCGCSDRCFACNDSIAEAVLGELSR